MARPVTKIGNLTEDPILRFSDKGTPWASFDLAVTPYTPTTKQQDKDHTEFYRIRCFRTLAEHVAESLRKGDRAIVQGDGQVEEYTKNDGTPDKAKVILANHVGAELRFATVEVTRIKRSPRKVSDPMDASDTGEPF